MKDQTDNPKQTFLVMKIIAAILLTGLLAIFTLHSNHDEGGSEAKLHYKIPDLGLASSRPLASDFQFQKPVGDNSTPGVTKTEYINSSVLKSRGQVLHIIYWAKWCDACVSEMPLIENYIKEFNKSSDSESSPLYQPVLVNLDENTETQNNVEEAKAMQMKLTPSSATIYEDQSSTKTLAQSMNIEIIPYHVIIDKSGKIAAEFYEPIEKNKSKFKRLILQLLAEEHAADSSR